MSKDGWDITEHTFTAFLKGLYFWVSRIFFFGWSKSKIWEGISSLLNQHSNCIVLVFFLNAMSYNILQYSDTTFRSLWMACPTTIRPFKMSATSFCTVRTFSPAVMQTVMRNLHKSSVQVYSYFFLSHRLWYLLAECRWQPSCNLSLAPWASQTCRRCIFQTGWPRTRELRCCPLHCDPLLPSRSQWPPLW